VVAGELICAAGVYRLAGWAGGPGTLGVAELPALVAGTDRRAALEAAQLAMAGRPVTLTLGIAAGPEDRWVTVTGRPVRGATGRLLRIDGTVRAGMGRRAAAPRPAKPPSGPRGA
jgi:hypothetical protein